MDVTSITSAFSAAKVLKELSTAALELKISKEAKEKILEAVAKASDIQEALFWVREELIRLQEENRELKNKLTAADQTAQLKKEVIWERPYYFRVSGEIKEGPFCQKCWDSSEKLIRLQGNSDRGSWNCTACAQYFEDSNYIPYTPETNDSYIV